MRIKLTVAYDGTDFCGWARQQGQRTVQSNLEEAIFASTRTQIEVTGASRTDSGAHALGQVCHFDTSLEIGLEKWPGILNKVLESDLSVVRAEEVGPDFHSRFCAEDRLYEYRIQTAARNPFKSRYTHELLRPLNLDLMKEAAQVLEGAHDFRAFTEELDPDIENTTRTLREVRVNPAEDEVVISIVGTAFLRGMMRRISGGLVEVGRGHRTLEDFRSLLTEQRVDLQWPVVLPAKGLTLVRVRYGDPPRDCRTFKAEPRTAGQWRDRLSRVRIGRDGSRPSITES